MVGTQEERRAYAKRETLGVDWNEAGSLDPDADIVARAWLAGYRAGKKARK